MARVSTRPFFLGGNRKPLKHESLFEDDDCGVDRYGDRVGLTLMTGAWTARHTQLARQYHATYVCVRDPSFGERRTADFLLDLPDLERASISLSGPADLSSLGRLPKLRSLRIDFGVGWRLGDKLLPVDFSGLRNLEHADIMMCRAFESILGCRTIKELTVRNDCDGRLRDLDLTQLRELRALELDHCPKLRTVTFHPRAKVRGLGLALCGSYKIDWPRMGKDLRFLKLGGRLTFPLEDVLNAPDLEELHTMEIRKLPPLGFLRSLKKLRVAFVFSAPPGPKFSADDMAFFEELRLR